METSEVLTMKAFQPLLEKGLPRGVGQQGHRISSAPPASGTKGLVALEVPQASAAEDVGRFPERLTPGSLLCAGSWAFSTSAQSEPPGGCCVFTSPGHLVHLQVWKPCLRYPGANSSQQGL